MLNSEIGIDLSKTMVIENPGGMVNDNLDVKLQTFKQELLRNPSIYDFTFSYTFPGKENFWISSFYSDKLESQDQVNIYLNNVDYNYYDLFNVKLLSGRNFSTKYATDDSLAVILNEAAINVFGFESPEEAINMQVKQGTSRSWNIVGVMNNYYDLSLKKQVEPMMTFVDNGRIRFFSVKVNLNNIDKTITEIKDEWNRVFAQAPFDYFFAEDFYNAQYQSDKKFNGIFGIFTFLALIVCSIGILGITIYIIEIRTKEIGIRKVLGSSISGLFILLSKEFTRYIIYANIVAWPAAYIIMKKWLQNFAVSISLDIYSFLLSGFIVFIIAILTISYHIIKAIFENPVKSLRYE
jgi:putative ABC transport system permease protein